MNDFFLWLPTDLSRLRNLFCLSFGKAQLIGVLTLHLVRGDKRRPPALVCNILGVDAASSNSQGAFLELLLIMEKVPMLCFGHDSTARLLSDIRSNSGRRATARRPSILYQSIILQTETDIGNQLEGQTSP